MSYMDPNGQSVAAPKPVPMMYNPATGRAEHRNPYQGYRPVDDQYKTYYQDHPDDLYSQYLGTLGDSNSNFYKYSANAFNRLFSQYLQASEGDPQLQWADYLGQNITDQLKNEWGGLSASQRGEDPRLFGAGFAGRFTG